MKRFTSIVAVLAAMVLSAQAWGADKYVVDQVHSSSVFRIKHANAAYFWGMFNAPGGSFVLDEGDLTKSSFTVEITVNNVMTGNEKRDAHLKSPDFFNAKQYPTITFKSTAVKKRDGNQLEVTGDLTMHGVTKSITAPVELTGKGEFPAGKVRAGIEATFTVKMTDFAMKGMPGALSDEVRVVVSLEGMKE